MRPEDYIRNHIRKILSEKSENSKTSLKRNISRKKTSRAGGGVRKEFRDMKARSETNPAKLMSDLGIKSLKDGEAHKVIEELLSQAVNGTEAMGEAYSSPKLLSDEFGRDGVVIKIVSADLPVRDGLFFIRHTVRGARNAKFIPFKDKINVEILDNSIVLYSSQTPYSWNISPTEAKKPEEKDAKPEEKDVKPEETR